MYIDAVDIFMPPGFVVCDVLPSGDQVDLVARFHQAPRHLVGTRPTVHLGRSKILVEVKDLQGNTPSVRPQSAQAKPQSLNIAQGIAAKEPDRSHEEEDL